MSIKTINPERGVLKQLAASLNSDLPVTMINLLAFRDRAYYDQDEPVSTSDTIDSNCTGRQAYATYSKQAAKFVAQVGGELKYYGEMKGIVIGPTDERWHQILIVRYPNFAAFLEMISNPDYQAITVHRTAALDDSRLWATQAP